MLTYILKIRRNGKNVNILLIYKFSFNKKMGFAKEQNDVIFITVSLTPSLQRFFNTHVSGASEVNTMLLLDCIDLVSSSVDSHVSIRKTQVSISKTYSNF